MPSLPTHPQTLTGSCFCRAITYTIILPTLPQRPLLPYPQEHPIGPKTETTKYFPIITFDHCTSCRRIAGSILEAWIISPREWVVFDLLLKESDERIVLSTEDVVKGKGDIVEITYLRVFSSSKDVYRTFCGRCGTHMSYDCSDEALFSDEEKDGKRLVKVDIPLGTLDKEFLEMEGMRPSEQAWVEDGISWVKALVERGVGSLEDGG